jgi:hypothetical protein
MQTKPPGSASYADALKLLLKMNFVKKGYGPPVLVIAGLRAEEIYITGS